MKKIFTNFDRIKAMSLDEMAEFFGAGMGEDSVEACSPDYCSYYDDDGDCSGKGPDRCVEAYARWLESEVKDDDKKREV